MYQRLERLVAQLIELRLPTAARGLLVDLAGRVAAPDDDAPARRRELEAVVSVCLDALREARRNGVNVTLQGTAGGVVATVDRLVDFESGRLRLADTLVQAARPGNQLQNSA